MSSLLVLLPAATTVRVDEFKFSIQPPPGWERVDTEKKGHVHFRKGDANIQILVVRSGAARWDGKIKDFLESFKPRHHGARRLAGH